MEPNASRKRTTSWGMQSEPPAAGLDGKDKHIHCPGFDEVLFYAYSLADNGASCFERTYIVTLDKGGGRR